MVGTRESEKVLVYLRRACSTTHVVKSKPLISFVAPSCNNKIYFICSCAWPLTTLLEIFPLLPINVINFFNIKCTVSSHRYRIQRPRRLSPLSISREKPEQTMPSSIQDHDVSIVNVYPAWNTPTLARSPRKSGSDYGSSAEKALRMTFPVTFP